MAMFGYMTEMEYVEMAEKNAIEAQGDDVEGLLFISWTSGCFYSVPSRSSFPERWSSPSLIWTTSG